MTLTLDLVLMILACISFGLAAASVPVGRINLVALGLLFWALTVVIPG